MRKLLPLVGGLLLLLTACSEQPATTQKKEPEKPPEPITGQSALFKMYQVARTWDPRALVLKMESMHSPQIPEVAGKAGMWGATFTSPTQGRLHSYTFSLIEELPSLHKGVFQVADEVFSGKKGVTQPFLIAAVKADTDAAYETAKSQPKAIEYDKKFPGKPITLLLEKNDRFPDPVWRVIWGESTGTSNFSVFVDASTGGFLEIMH
ncbi:MAG TPA: hypothetical protein VG456_11940 [Candidatus Sulfopaludibacter sp.]|jgi:hypothetical protein|nr:hypothetical protein [Candidatus Sulfopaludibacter sp.]